MYYIYFLLFLHSHLKVGEHLLSLVNEFESFSSSDAIYDLVPLSGTASEIIAISKCWRGILPEMDISEVVYSG